MITFERLPVTFPVKGGSAGIFIENYDTNWEQRASYPYTYVSTVGLNDSSSRQSVSVIMKGVEPDKKFKTKNTETVEITTSAKPFTPNTPRVRSNTLSGILVHHIDELSCMYSLEWMKEAEDKLRFEIMSFLADADVSSSLGKTRCRDCLYYFERPSVKPSKSRIASLATFLSFFLDAKIQVGEDIYLWKGLSKDIQKQVSMDHLDNGHWVTKNDIV